MTDILLYILAAVAALNTVLLILVLMKRRGNGSLQDTQLEALSRQLGDEFSRSRIETERGQKSQRAELSGAIAEMGQKLERLTADNYALRVESMKTVATGLEEIRQSSMAQTEKQARLMQTSLERMQQSNEQRLEQMRLTVDEKLSSTLTARLDSSFKTVSLQLEHVYKSLGEMKALSAGVTDNVTSLNRILTNVKARGTWAEVQLEGLLNQTIPGLFDRNVRTNPLTQQVVEFAVRIPSSEDKSTVTYLPIDSKFPMEDYLRLCAAADMGDREAVAVARKSLSRRVLSFAADVSKYINEPATTPFAIMYLATESLYGEIIGSQEGVAERIQNEYGVMVAGPGTITALLNSLAMGFRAFAVNEKTKEIRELLAVAKGQYEKFGEVLARARKKIDEAGKSLEDAQSRNDIIRKRLRGVEETGFSDQ